MVLCSFYKTAVGKKVVMAVTGAALVLFVVGHMVGNLKIFLGYDLNGLHALDHYAEMLRSIGEDFLGHGNFLWLVRGGLLACVALHVVSAIQLFQMNRLARPTGYAVAKYNSSTLASRTMSLSGTAILIFVVLHILHFTTGTIHFDGFIEGKVYANVYAAFQRGYIAFGYVLAMALLCAHLSHGMWSMFQTLGLDGPEKNCALRLGTRALAFVLFLGFIAVPLSLFFGVLPPPMIQ